MRVQGKGKSNLITPAGGIKLLLRSKSETRMKAIRAEGNIQRAQTMEEIEMKS